jgi:hypothetical protein
MLGTHSRTRSVLVCLSLLAAPALFAQTGPDPREQSFQIYIDGVLTPGIIGYRIEFNHDPVPRTDSRRLDREYSPDQRRLALSVTQKGLNRLQDWINSATDTGTPIVKSVAVVARDQQQNVLARWEFTEVQPATLASTGQGQLTEVTATIEFSYSTFKQTQAKPD